MNTCAVSISQLVPGDHIYVNRGFFNSHHGVYVGYQGCTHWVVHHDSENKVVQTSLEQFLQGGELRRAIYNAGIVQKVARRRNSVVYSEESSDVQTIVQRALDSVDHHESNPWIYDAESFAKFCKTGKLARRDSLKDKTQLTLPVAGSVVGASVGFTVGGPVGLLIGGVIGATVSLPVLLRSE